MEILFLGTGSCIPTPKKDNKPQRYSTGFILDAGDQTLMFDIGSGALQKMLMSGIDILQKPTHLFITHFHPDHCADVIALMQSRKVARQNGIEIKPLNIYGPEGSNAFFDSLFTSIEKWRDSFGQPNTSELFWVNESIPGIVTEGNNWKVMAAPVQHFNSLAYRLEIDGKSVTYSGDMGHDENFSELGKDTDLAIMECSYPDRETLTGNHLCPEDIGNLAKLGGFKQIALTHIYPACEGREEEMVAKIHEFTDAPVTVAHDLLRISV